MTIQQLAALAKGEKAIGLRYQKGVRAGFRDLVTVYYDGKLLFQRFCYGESAGLVFEMTGSGAGADGTLLWDYDACLNSKKIEAPTRLTDGDAKNLFFDDKRIPWECVDRLKNDPTHGYSALSCFFKRLGGM